MNELKKYLTPEEIEQLKNNNGFIIARVRIPANVFDRICDRCNTQLIGECYAVAYFMPFHPRGQFYPNRWYLRYLFCHDCGKEWSKDTVFVDNYIIPSLQAYLEWYLGETNE